MGNDEVIETMMLPSASKIRMRVLLISTNKSREIMPVMPNGAACVPSILDEHEVHFLDLFLQNDPVYAIKREIAETQPGLVALSIRNIDNQLRAHTEFYIPQIKTYVEAVRKATTSPIIIGGPAVNIFPKEILDHVGADWALVGDAEVVLPEFMRVLENCYDPSKIEGVVSKNYKGPRPKTPRVVDYDAVSFPAYEIINLQEYAKMGGSLSVLARRGCPRHCAYCDAPIIEGAQMRGKKPARLVAELEAASRLDVKSFNIADNIFNYPPDYAEAVCDEILRRDLKISWGASIHPQGMTGQLLDKMKKAGFSFASVGVDSGSDKILKRLKKDAAVEDYKKLVSLLNQKGITFYISLLLGAPGESMETIEESVEFAQFADANLTNIRVGIRISPYTDLHNTAISEGKVSPEDNLLEPKFYTADGTETKAYELIEKHLKGKPGLFIQ